MGEKEELMAARIPPACNALISTATRRALAATTMSEFAIHFGRDHGEASLYKLLELPKELVEVVKNGTDQQLSVICDS